MSKAAQIHITDRPKVADGWRAGRPVEDPDKVKRWGFVSAKPSEFLVHVRRGSVLPSSGQGATCFKWPWDSVAVIPTSLQQLRFKADQVTLEKVGIEVTGLAVYRIADPQIAYRVLNFSYPERAQEKLEETLTSMFVGAARRLIANLTLDDCLQKRKSAIAVELLHEVAPVVGGDGRPDDHTNQGWGVVLDTIEIQEVRVLSDATFAQMQAPFRVGLDRRAREARAEAEKEVTAREAACQRAIEEARIQAALVIAESKKQLVERELEIKREEELIKARVARELEEHKLLEAAALRRRQLEIEIAEREAQVKKALRLEELGKQEAEAELATFAVLAEAAHKRTELERARFAVVEEQRRAEAALKQVEGESEAAVLLAKARAEQTVVDSRVRLRMAEKLPELANAVGQKFGEVKVTHIGEGASPFATVAQAVGAVLELAKSA
ncbi:MAG: hypothetical protein HYS27_08355 [Deltaproteobacteria bacterium]|nr:hypothetical protein [Deltaproteobacteria bacterium]